jgi:hypothetical protein
MESRITIAVYKPLAGKEKELEVLMQTHHSRLLNVQLVTDRRPIIMKSEDGTILEVFEWKSKEAIHAAHSHPDVLAMWAEFSAVCEYLPTNQVKEIGNMFSEFTPLN